MKAARGRVDIGAVFEIPTPRGLAYAQYSHWNSEMGALVRVLPGFHSSRPVDLASLVNQTEQYSTFFPLQAAVRQGIFEVIGHAPVPPRARGFPIFRSIGGITNDGRPLNWWLWDGQKEWFVGDNLTAEQRRLPPKIVMTDVALIERLTRGWTPEADFATSNQKPQESASQENASRDEVGGLKHFLYFPDESKARKVASDLEREGLSVTLGPGAEESDWLVLVHQAPGTESADVERLRSKLDRTAARHGGEYDGWEMRVSDGGT